jgi:hypothetical protein
MQNFEKRILEPGAKSCFPHGSGLARAPSAVFAHMQERPSQWLVAGGAFCQIRFFGFLLRISFDIALTTMAVVGSKKFRERRTFFDRFRRKEKGRHHCRPSEIVEVRGP